MVFRTIFDKIKQGLAKTSDVFTDVVSPQFQDTKK